MFTPFRFLSIDDDWQLSQLQQTLETFMLSREVNYPLFYNHNENEHIWNDVGLQVMKGLVQQFINLPRGTPEEQWGPQYNTLINHFAYEGGPALAAAARSGALHMVRDLIRAGVNVDALDGQQQTALMHAAKEGNKNVMALLVQMGANINATVPMFGVKMSPINFAARGADGKKAAEIVRWCVHQGATVDFTTRAGVYVAQCLENHDPELLRTLKGETSERDASLTGTQDQIRRYQLKRPFSSMS